MKPLHFLNLMDGQKLSLTNITLVIIMVKIAVSPFDYAGAAVLLPILASYIHKRHITSKQASSQLEDFQSQLDSISQQVLKVETDHEEVVKTQVETKKIISNANLATAFSPRR